MRLIDADATASKLRRMAVIERDMDQIDIAGATLGIAVGLQSDVLYPTIDPVKHGHWIFDEQWWYPPVCSVCKQPAKTPGYIGDYAFYREHFPCCPHCGAKLFNEENDGAKVD